MDLLVSLQNNMSSGLLWSAVSGRQLGRLESCAHLTLQLSLIAIRTGLLVRLLQFYYYYYCCCCCCN